MTKILLVDDSKFLRLATESALARASYEVSTATDGERALEVAREKKRT
jgi:CheY-like chemotaxis protein